MEVKNNNSPAKGAEEDFDLSSFSEIVKGLPNFTFSEISKSSSLYKLALICAARGNHTEYFKQCALFTLRRQLQLHSQFLKYLGENFLEELHVALLKEDFDIAYKLLIETTQRNCVKSYIWISILPSIILFSCPPKLIYDFINTRLKNDRLPLLNSQLFLNNADFYSLTPLIYAILVGNNDYVKILLKFGANVDRADYLWDSKDSLFVSTSDNDIFIGGNKTPLMYAICVENLECVQTLLKYKANLKLKCCRKMNALCYAVELNKLSFLELLINAPIGIHKNELMSDSSAFTVSNKKVTLPAVLHDFKGLTIEGLKTQPLKRRFDERSAHPREARSRSHSDGGNETEAGDDDEGDFSQSCDPGINPVSSETVTSVNKENDDNNVEKVLFGGLLSSGVDSSFTFRGNDVLKHSLNTKNNVNFKTFTSSSSFNFADNNITWDFGETGLSKEVRKKSNESKEKETIFNFGNASLSDNVMNFNFQMESDSNDKFSSAENASDDSTGVNDGRDSEADFDINDNTKNHDGASDGFNFDLSLFKASPTPTTFGSNNSFKILTPFSHALPAFNFKSSDKSLIESGAKHNKNHKRLNKRKSDRKKVESHSNCDSNTFEPENFWKDNLYQMHDWSFYLNNLKIAAEESLPIAVVKGDINCIKLILTHCGDINRTIDSTGYSALMIASNKGNEELVCMLLNNWPDIELTASNGEGETSLMLAAKNGHVNCVKLLLKYNASLHTMNKYKETALMYALRSNHLDCVKVLLENKASLNIKSIRIQGPEFPLMVSSINGDVELVKFLLEKNAPVDEIDHNGDTSLMGAVNHSNLNCMQVLLDHKADVNHKNHQHESPLMDAVKIGDLDVIKLLLAYKANVNHKDRLSNSILHVAIQKNQKDCIPILLENGARIELKDNDGSDALCLAAKLNSIHYVQLFIDHLKKNNSYSELKSTVQDVDLGAVMSDALPYTVMTSSENDCFDLILPYCTGFDSVVMSENMTALMFASKFGKEKLLEILLDKGANVNYNACEKGLTALAHATKNKQMNCVKILLQHGANPDIATCGEQKPVFYAIENNDFECLNLLLKDSKDIQPFTSKQSLSVKRTQSLIVLAITCQSDQCLEVLINAGFKTPLSDICENCSELFGKPNEVQKLLESEALFLDSKPVDQENDAPDMPANDLVIESMELLMKHNLFDWRYWNCSSIDFVNLIPLAVDAGINPGFIYFDGTSVSPLKYFLLADHSYLAMFLVSNLFFKLDDYRFVTSDADIKSQLRTRFDSSTNKFLHHICVNPWNLQTICLLTISTAMFNNGRKVSRQEQVQSLPIPERFKTILNFKTPLSDVEPECEINVMSLPKWLRAGFSE